MREINIQTYGVELNGSTKKHILQRLHSVFGYDEYKVNKIVITLLDKNAHDEHPEISCYIKIYIKNQSPIKTKLKSLDLFSAITLAIERAKIKLDRCINNPHQENMRIRINEKTIRYGSYRIYQ